MGKFEIVRLQKIESTNDYLKKIGSERDMVAVAEMQTAGRGAGTNMWESEPGKNLTFSILIHPTFIRPDKQFLISMGIANAIQETVGLELGAHNVQPMIKWPNDIYIDNKKICGILIENSLRNGLIKDCIIGIGLNINQRNFISDAPNPVSMIHVLKRELNRKQVLDQLLESFEKQLIMLENGKETEIRKQYLEHLYRKGVMSGYKDSTGEFKARIEGVEDDGHLVLVDNRNEIRKYAFKEIEFII